MRAVELGEFLRSRRTRPEISRPGPGRRTIGLRREELSSESGVAHSWIVKLEQGRAKSVSADVLAALSRSLELDAAERSHLFALAGYRIDRAPSAAELTAPMRVLLDQLEPNPAYLLDRAWDLLAWNRAEVDLFPPLQRHTGGHVNLLELAFLDGDLAELMVDVDEERERLVAQYRAHIVDFPNDPRIAIVVDRLRHASVEFRELWDRRDVRTFHTTRRYFAHERNDWRILDHHRLAVLDQPGVQLVVYTPVGPRTLPS